MRGAPSPHQPQHPTQRSRAQQQQSGSTAAFFHQSAGCAEPPCGTWSIVMVLYNDTLLYIACRARSPGPPPPSSTGPPAAPSPPAAHGRSSSACRVDASALARWSGPLRNSGPRQVGAREGERLLLLLLLRCGPLHKEAIGR